ncbi:MAG: hypothetical protein JW751_10700 [Polyangiaceae bacterium]|nr:hypothetical protein [Polyangiaceae bacterium]
MLPRPAARLVATSITCALGLAPGTAGASGALELAGAPTSANGLTARALARHAETAYFNPALLPRAAPLMEVGYFALHTQGTIDLDARPEGVDVPESVYDAHVIGDDGSAERLELRPLPTNRLPEPRRRTKVEETRGYALVGLVRPFFADNVSFGLFAILPLRGFLAQNGFFADEREQYFSNRLDYELLGDRAGISSFTVSLGGRVARWLAAGIGANLGFSTVTRFDVYVPDAADQSTILLDPEVKTATTLSPVGGLALYPSPDLTMTVTTHAPVGVETSGENLLRFWNYDYPDDQDHIRQAYVFSQGYVPLRVGFGAAFARGTRPEGNRRWEFGTSLVITQWSEYRDRHGERPADRWKDTLTPALGVAMMTDHGRFVVDLAYVPTPVPEQTGRSNYVDNSRALVSLGWEAPLTVLGSPLGIGLYVHGQWLVPRSVTKRPEVPYPVLDEFPDGATDFVTGGPIDEADGLQTNNPGYPGFSSRGYLLGGGFSVRLPR